MRQVAMSGNGTGIRLIGADDVETFWRKKRQLNWRGCDKDHRLDLQGIDEFFLLTCMGW